MGMKRRELRRNPFLAAVISDFSVNLAAAWFGAAFIGPNFFGIKSPFNLFILTGDIIACILFLLIAVKLKKVAKI